jgi:hypothetical protein
MGIKNQFAAALQSPTFKLVVRGVQRMYAENNPGGLVKKLAFTLELVKHLNDALPSISASANVWKEGLRRRALVVGMELGIYFLLRRSEFLPCRTSGGARSRGLQWKDVSFLDKEGHLIPFHLVSIFIADSVSVLVRKSKTDQLGEGRVRTHRKQFQGHCIVKVLVNWLSELRALGADAAGHVFEYDESSIIDDIAIADAMRAITRFAGLRDNMTSTHSLRYGGATLLAAAGIPAYAITHFGGWAEDSKMIRQYVQLGGQMTDDVSRVMSEAFNKPLTEARTRENTLSRRDV